MLRRQAALNGVAVQSLAELPSRAAEIAAQRPTSSDLEAVRVALLGKKGVITAQLKSLGAMDPRGAQARGREDQRSEGSADRGARRASRGARSASSSQRNSPATPSMSRLPGRGQSHRRTASGHARAAAHRADLPRRRLHGRRRSGDRGRLAQLQGAEHPREPSGAGDARHVLFRPTARLLRTHTSPVQVRVHAGASAADARHRAGPRLSHDSDMTHTPMFHQVEGLVVDEGISFANLKAVLHGFMQEFFERTSACGCGRRTFRSPSRRPKSTFPASRAAAPAAACASRPAGSSRGLRRGASERAAACEHRSRALHGLRVRHGHRAAHDAALRRQRPAPVLRERPALPAAVRLMKISLQWLRDWVDTGNDVRGARARAHDGRPRGRRRSSRRAAAERRRRRRSDIASTRIRTPTSCNVCRVCERHARSCRSCAARRTCASA